jgi:demethylmenaquinone methyltransferase/2-methoxy-6-polyprenyl-1,4-benzoquinol methylase
VLDLEARTVVSGGRMSPVAESAGAGAADPTRAFYNRISRVYDRLSEASEHASRDAGLELLAAAPAERVLEIGCGTGTAAVELARAVGPEGRVVAVDLAEGMLAETAARLTAEALTGRARPLQADARRLPFRDRTFAAAFSSFTLELFEPDDAGRVLAEVRRVLGPGGRLVVVSLAEPDHTRPMVELYRWLHRHFPHFVDCRPIEVERWLEAAGFTVGASRRLSMWGLTVAAVTAHVG